MNVRLSLLSALALVSLSAAPARAADGVVMVQTITNGASVTSTQVQIEPTRMRTEISGPGGPAQTVIFDGTRDVVLLVNAAQKTYSELTRADAERLGGVMKEAMAKMQAQLDAMPPQQRAMMEKQMGPMLSGMAAGARPQYRRAGSGRVGKWACDRYDGYTGTTKTAEICTVAPSVLGLTAADFAVTAKMMSFVGSMLPQMADQLVGLGTPDQGFSGLPISSSTTSGGTTFRMELTDVRRETFPDSLFQVPAGFKPQPFGIPGR